MLYLLAKRYRWLFLKACLVLTALPFLGLSYYNQPYSDDYDMGNLVKVHGFWGGYQYFYAQWSGRFFTNAFFIFGNPLAYNWLKGMWLPVLVGLAMKLGVLVLGLRSFTTGLLPRATSLWLAGGLLLVYLASIPDVYSAVFYFTDIAVYQLPALLLLVVPIAIHRAQGAPVTQRGRWLLVAGAGTLAGAGSNELTVALLGWLLLVGFVVSLYRRQFASARIWFGLGSLLLVAGLFALNAPGNHVRMQLTGAPASSLAQVAHRLLTNVRAVFGSSGLYAVLVLPLLAAPLGRRLLPGRPAGLVLPLPLGALILLVGVVLGCLPYAYVWELPMPIRATNILLWWLLVGWLLACWASMQPTTRALSPAARGLIASYLLLSVAYTSLRAWQEWLLEAPQYACQWQARYVLFRQAALQPGTKLTVGPMLHVVPHRIMIQGYDIQPNYDFATNGQLAKWFGLEAVRTDPEQMKRAAF